MAGPRKLIAGSIAALALVALAVFATTASSRGTGFDFKVSKHPDGPFREDTRIGVQGNQKKSITWRAKSKSDDDQGMYLFANSNPDGYKVNWFKGHENISQDVEQTIGYEFTLKARKSKLFRAEVKAGQNADPAGCIDAGIMDQGLVFTDHALAGLNTNCTM